MKLNSKITLIGCLALLWSSTAWAQEKPERWTLESCVEYARAHNLTVKRQELNVLGQEANLKQQRASQLPSFNMSTNVGQSFGRSLNPVEDTYATTSFISGNVSANASVTVFNGFSLRNSIRQQNARVDASRYDLEKAKNDIAMNVINAYLNVIFNQELLDNSRFQLESTQKQVERIEKLVEAGALPPSDLLELKAQAANLEFRVVNAENNLALAFVDLKQLLQLEADEQLNIERPDVEVQKSKVRGLSPVTIYETAQAFMPEIKSAAKQVESARYGVKSAKGNYSPRLSFGAGISTNYSNVERPVFTGDTNYVQQQTQVLLSGSPVDLVFQNAVPERVSQVTPYGEQLRTNLGQNIGFNLSIPIFNGLQTRTGVQRAQISLQQAELNKKDQSMRLRQTIERAYSDALAAAKNYEAAQAQVEAMKEVFRVTEERYAMGAANSVDFNLASNNLNRAKSDLVRAKYEYIFKTKLLDFYQGNSLY